MNILQLIIGLVIIAIILSVFGFGGAAGFAFGGAQFLAIILIILVLIFIVGNALK